MSKEVFNISIKCEGVTRPVELPQIATGADLFSKVQAQFAPAGAPSTFKCIWRGKQLQADGTALASLGLKSGSKVLALRTAQQAAAEIKDKRPDPLMRSIEQEEAHLAAQRDTDTKAAQTVWNTEQDKQHKFCRFGALKRFEGQVPHPFAAREHLRTLATDPGIVAIMRAHGLVVGRLEEMDPDDRLAEVTEKTRGGCLLGYNQNHGSVIYIRLRTLDSPPAFRPYPELIDTLIHELTHNLVSPHDLLFWRAFRRLKLQYLLHHQERAQFPLRHAPVKSGAPAAQVLATRAECEASVQRQLAHEATSNAALSAEERAACLAAARETVSSHPVAGVSAESVSGAASGGGPDRAARQRKLADATLQRLAKKK